MKTDTFSIRRSLSDGHFNVVSQESAQDGLKNFSSFPIVDIPGSRLDGAFWLSDNALACQDGAGIRRLDLKGELYSPVQTPFNKDNHPSLSRFAGQLTFGWGTSHLVLRENGNYPELQFIASDEDAGRQRIGGWQVRQTRPDSPVSMHAKDANDRDILIGDANSTGPNLGGALLVDRVQMVTNLKGDPVIVLPAGVQYLGRKHEFLSADDEARSILSAGSLRMLQSTNGSIFLVSRRMPNNVVHLDQSLSLGVRDLIGFESLYLGANDDWRIYRNIDEELVFERPIATDSGQQVDRIKGEDIFSGGGQFSFDRVISVAADSEKGGDLVISTDRTVEIVRFTPKGLTLRVQQLGKAELLPSKRRSLPSVSWNGEAKMTVDYGGRSLRLSAPQKWNSVDASPQLERSLPRAFETNNRAWIVEPSGVHWVETGNRWNNRRRELEVSR